jgi:hypothetical protein
MILTTTPFTEEEKKKEYDFSFFRELGIPITILNLKTSKKQTKKGNLYKFGVFEDGNFYWYFNGKTMAHDREKMREIFSALLDYNKDKQKKPFIFKIK